MEKAVEEQPELSPSPENETDTTGQPETETEGKDAAATKQNEDDWNNGDIAVEKVRLMFQKMHL